MKKQDKNKYRFLIFGPGQIGTMYHKYFLSKGYMSSLSKVDITNLGAVETAVVRSKATVVINTAAKTNLEWVEKNKLKAFNINVLGAENVAVACLRHKVFLIHLSSGCIFESKSPQDAKNEESPPSPAAFYSWTKVWAENLILSNKKLKVLVVRPRQPVSSQVSEKNMLVKMLTFSKFVGKKGGWNSGTVLEDMMWITVELLDKSVTGVIHIANEGWVTPYQIALLLKKYVNPKMKFEEISHSELDKMTPVKRVATVLDISRLKSLGIKPKNYEERLEELVIELAQNLKDKSGRSVLQKTEKTSKQRTKTSAAWRKMFN